MVLDVEPTPIPVPVYEITASRQRLLNGRDSGAIVPGKWHVYNGGCSESGRKLPINIPYLSIAQYLSVIAKAKSTTAFQFNDGTTTYSGVLSPDTSPPQVIAGTQILTWNPVMFLDE